MNAGWGIIGFVVMAVVGLVTFVIRTEYRDWGRRLARCLVRFAASDLGQRRDERREEWLAELDAVWDDTDKACTGLTFAGGLAIRYGMWTLLKESFLLYPGAPFIAFAAAHPTSDGSIASQLATMTAVALVSMPLVYLVFTRQLTPARVRAKGGRSLANPGTPGRVERPPWGRIIGLLIMATFMTIGGVTFIIVTAIMNARPLALAALALGLVLSGLTANRAVRVLNDARQQSVP